MKKLIVLILLSAIGASAFAQTKNLTFTNISGVVYSNVAVIQVEWDGILFRLSDGANYGRVKFTNMSQSLQLKFGYDPEKIRKAQEDRIAKAKADEVERIARAKADEVERIARAKADEVERIARAKADEVERIARVKAAQHDSIKGHKSYIRPIDENDFPKTEKAKTVCKEIVSELKGINKAIEFGLNYAKFADLLTEKVLAIEKIKDLRGEGIPYSFLTRVDQCEDAYKESRDLWHKQIENTEFPESKPFEDFVMRGYWSLASVRLTYCIGIAECNTNVNSAVIVQVAEMIKTEQDAVKLGILKANDYLDPTVANLTVEQISSQIQLVLSPTNTPSTGTQP